MLIDEDRIRAIGLSMGLAGLLCLALLSPEYGGAEPKEITEKMAGKKVSVSGEVRNFFISKGNAFFELWGNGTVKAVIFRPSAEQLSQLRESGLVKAKGTVSINGGNAGIIVDRVSGID
ncbi:Uncharacterised protein [uncultured archaeon]|nr:Uncharacterised protein [uncultured archaeon]